MKGSPAAAKSYAKALFALARERNQTEAIARDLATLVDLLGGNPELAAFFSRPWIAAVKKRAAASEVATQAAVSPLARDFFALVVAQGRADHLGAIAAAYRELDDADRGCVRARVRTAVALTDDERARLAARLGREVGGKRVIFEETVDADFLGGFVAQIGSLVLDGSLDGQLARLKARLATA